MYENAVFGKLIFSLQLHYPATVFEPIRCTVFFRTLLYVGTVVYVADYGNLFYVSLYRYILAFKRSLHSVK